MNGNAAAAVMKLQTQLKAGRTSQQLIGTVVGTAAALLALEHECKLSAHCAHLGLFQAESENEIPWIMYSWGHCPN